MDCSKSIETRVLPRAVAFGRLLLAIAAALAVVTAPHRAPAAQIKFTGFAQINGAPSGPFAAFTMNEVVDMTITIDETTADSNGAGGAGSYSDPTSTALFEGQTSVQMVTFTGFGFELLDSTRLDPANGLVSSSPSAAYVEDWDLTNLSPISNVDDLPTIIAELPNVNIGTVSANFSIQQLPAGPTTLFLGLKPTVTVTDFCGNGIVEAPEACDDPVCCNPTCTAIIANGTECRASAGVCDVAETCSNGACPVDGFASIGTVCNPSLGVCDPEEVCSGSSAECPPDTLTQFTCGTICGAPVDECDVADICVSGNVDCPPMGTMCTPTPVPTPTPTPVPENGSGDGACSDGLDNDNDNLIDCDDPDCLDVEACETVHAPTLSPGGLTITVLILALIGLLAMGRAVLRKN